MKIYTPKKGDFIIANFNPQSGHEQKGFRPALVISTTPFNKLTGLVIVCPLTSSERGFPLHVSVTDNPDVHGFIMVEQVKSIDYKTRQVKPIGKASQDLLEEVLAILDACIY
ncbi:MAG: type II toxin-antitoxin system PemK/MazF family toxin [Dehalococcoidales bacterium]|jgi:mRNA interferase MazF